MQATLHRYVLVNMCNQMLNMAPRNPRTRRRRKSDKSRISRRTWLAIALLALIGVMVVWSSMRGQNGSGGSRVLLRTSMGDIVIELHEDMPITAGNFKMLVQQGTYDGTIFHRVIDGFMIQGGDPTGTGYGDPLIPSIPDEFTDHNRNTRGTVAMANAGPNTGSSQFFINLVDNNYLDTKHPVFGQVIDGMDVVDAIGKVETDENDRPRQEVRIFTAELAD
jgi:peptidylprolyl isomerase